MNAQQLIVHRKRVTSAFPAVAPPWSRPAYDDASSSLKANRKCSEGLFFFFQWKYVFQTRIVPIPPKPFNMRRLLDEALQVNDIFVGHYI